MSTVNDLLNILAAKEKDVGDEEKKRQREKVIIKRYFPGKAPDYAKDAREDGEEDDDGYDEYSNDGEKRDHVIHRKEVEKEEEQHQAETGQLKHFLKTCRKYEDDDERYKIFEKKKEENKITGDKEERLKRRVREVVILEKEEEEQKKVVDIIPGNDADDMGRVDFFHDRNEHKEKKEEEEEEEEEKEEYDEEYDEEDYDDDSYMDEEAEDGEEEDEDAEKGDGKDTKPNFILKGKRETLIKRKKAEEDEEKQMKNIKKVKEQIEQESKENAIKESLYHEMMEEELRKKGGNVFSSEEEFEENDEEDYSNEEIKQKEYMLWRIREINRLKRDEIERKKYDMLKEKMKKRRKMTDKEIIEDNKNMPNKQKQKKEKMLFLQKYYHKGGFYQDLFEEGKEEIYKRNYNEPVYEDKIDKTKLPKVLRLRRGNWGKQGRTKYTHLMDNDTSVKDSLWKEGELNPSSKKKTDLLDRPTYRRK